MSIRLSPRHGVNPMLIACFYCGEETGEIALMGALRGDIEAPRRGAINHTPCEKCQGHMKEGVMLIAVDMDQTVDMTNPFRTGQLCVIKEEAIKRMLPPGPMLSSILEKRMAYVPDTEWNEMGLP